jgi:hypothetical protein
MRPAASKAPFDYLFAFAVCVVVIGTSFVVKPATTEWVVFGVGVFMAVSVLVAAAKPVRD